MIPNFIYFVNLEDSHVCHNLGFVSTLLCASIAHFETFKEEHPVYRIEPDRLLNEINSLQTFLTPRLSLILTVCWRRNNYRVGIGQHNTKYFSEDYLDKIERIAILEIEFEKIRRQIDPQLPSRLMCIYLAEDNLDGRLMLQNMFFDKKHFFIVPVKIVKVNRLHIADPYWIDEYERTKNTSAIENYWKSIPFSKSPKYEYLLDGRIELIAPSDKENILKDFRERHIPQMKNRC